MVHFKNLARPSKFCKLSVLNALRMYYLGNVLNSQAKPVAYTRSRLPLHILLDNIFEIQLHSKIRKTFPKSTVFSSIKIC
jgi:hypothetical protein